MKEENEIALIWWILGVFTLIFLIILYFFILAEVKKIDKLKKLEEVSCIVNKTKLYISSDSEATDNQIKELGEYYEYFNVVDCQIDGFVCFNEKISSIPTWVLNEGIKFVGVKDLNYLKNLTGC